MEESLKKCPSFRMQRTTTVCNANYQKYITEKHHLSMNNVFDWMEGRTDGAS